MPRLGMHKVMRSLCDGSWDLVRSYGVRGNASALSHPVFRHWCEQQPVSHLSHCAVGAILALICVASVLGNLLVLVVFTRYRRLRSPANILIVNLAASDLLNGLLHPMAALSSFRGRWTFHRAGCEAYAALCGLFGLVSIVTLTAIALERCLVISARPFRGTGGLLTRSGARAAAALVWLYCGALVAPPLALGWGAFVPEGFLTSCSFDYLSRTPANRAYFCFLFAFGFFLPVTLIGVCYTFILQTVFQNERSMRLNHVTKSHRSKVRRSEYRAAEMILLVIALFLASWTPYSLVACLGQFGDRRLLTPWVSTLPSLFAKMSTLYNPAVYALSHPHFRAALARMLGGGARHSSSLGRTACPCLPRTSDVLEDNSSSLTGRRVCAGSLREELCACGRVRAVSRDYASRLNDSSARLQYIPASKKLTCVQPPQCISVAHSICRHPFRGKGSVLKLHVLEAQADQRREVSDRDRYAAPETPCGGDSLQRGQSTSCMSVASAANEHSLCVKLRVLDLHSDRRRQKEYESPFECHRDAPGRLLHRFPSNNDFVKPFIAKHSRPRSKSQMDAYKRREFATSMEFDLVREKSVDRPEISCSSEGSIRGFYDECPVLRIKHEDKLNAECTVCGGGESRRSDKRSPLKPSRESAEEPSHSCDCRNRGSECESALSETESCFDKLEICVLEVESESNPKFQKLPHSRLEMTRNQNSKSLLALNRKELLKCHCKNKESEYESALLKQKCCNKLKTCVLEVEPKSNPRLPHSQSKSTRYKNSEILGLGQEDLPMGRRCTSASLPWSRKGESVCISNSWADDLASQESHSNGAGRTPSLAFCSERSIHQAVCESRADRSNPESIESGIRPPIPESRRATLLLEAGRMKKIIRRSSVNES